MEKSSWVPTLVAQACLCFSLYLAFQLGQPQKPMYHGTSGTRPLDLYFISVGGGFRPVNQQTHLLKQMEKVVKKYKAKFVVDISNLGKDDPLMQNGTGSLGGFGNNQLHWLKRTLEATSSNWRIVVGFHPLAICEDGEEGMGAKKVFESLQLIFMKFEVNAYLSGQGCASSVRRRSLSYLGNPGRMEDGFLLHRVSALEIVTYLVSSGGEIVHKSVLHQRGKEIM